MKRFEILFSIKRFFSGPTKPSAEPIRCPTLWLDSLGQDAVVRFVYERPDGSVVTVDEDAFGNRAVDPSGETIPSGPYQ